MSNVEVFGVCLLPPPEWRASFRLGILTASDEELVGGRDAIRATIERAQVFGRDLLLAWSLHDIVDWTLFERARLRGMAREFWGMPAPKWPVKQPHGLGGVLV